MVVKVALAAKAPKARKTNTAATTANSAARTAVVRSAATSIRVVKMAQAIRYQPAATPWCSVGMLSAKNVRYAQNDNQNAP